MSNPLTALKKLGIRLVGDNGLLDTAAAAHYGLGPLAKQKMIDEARKTALTEATSIQDLEAGNLNMEGKRIDNTGKLQTQNQSQQLFPHELKQKEVNANKGQLELDEANRLITSRNKARPKFAKDLGANEDEVDGLLELMQEAHKAGKIKLPANVAKELGLDADTYVDNSIVDLRGQNKRAEQQIRAIEAAERRAAARDKVRDQTRFDKIYGKADEISRNRTTDPQFRADKIVLQRVDDAMEVMDKLRNTANADPKGQYVITNFNKVMDAMSVVRETEYARTGERSPLVTQIDNILRKWGKGEGGFNPDLLDEVMSVMKIAGDQAMARQEQELVDFKTRMRFHNDGIDLPEDFITATLPIHRRKNKSNPIVDSILGTN